MKGNTNTVKNTFTSQSSRATKHTEVERGNKNGKKMRRYDLIMEGGKEGKEQQEKDRMAKDQETEQHKQVSVKLPCYFSHDGPCGGCPKPITSREF